MTSRPMRPLRNPARFRRSGEDRGGFQVWGDWIPAEDAGMTGVMQRSPQGEGGKSRRSLEDAGRCAKVSEGDSIPS